VGDVGGVLLDVGGVLLLPDSNAIAAHLGNWGVHGTGHDHAEVHYRSVAAFDRSGDIADYRRKYCRLLGVPAGAVEVCAESAAFGMPWTIVVPGVKEALSALADAGVTLVVVSDSDGSVDNQLLSAAVAQVGQGPGVTLAGICDSTHVGARKPDPVMFHAGLDVGGLTASTAVMIGDSARCDVAGAHECGIRAVHVDPLALCTATDCDEHISGAHVLFDYLYESSRRG
jgi:putative hydrolase of the HAD superfamily